MSKKTKTNGKDAVKLSIRYGVAIPERDLMDILRLDCAGRMASISKDLASVMNKLAGEPTYAQMIPTCKEMDKVFSVTAVVLKQIQDAWKDALQNYAEETKLSPVKSSAPTKPVNTPKSGPALSETEKQKVRALRKQGLSIKAIGKEIHRAEKVVAAFVRTLPKK